MQRRFSQLSLLLWFVVAGSAAAFGQSGAIQGTLVDPQGQAIANAKITVIDEAKGLTVREMTTAEDGKFQLLPLLQGRYTIKVGAAGFKTLERTGLVLDPYQIMNLGELGLEIGDITNTVTIEGEAPLVETATAQKSFVITSEQVTGVATNGRDFRSLLRTLPGVTSNTASDFNLAFNSTQGFNVNGLRDTANNVYLDGTINTDVGANDGQFTQMSLDAIGEFKVQSSVFNAEHGRNPGVLISATTKSGGRQFHGTAYEFLRNEALDARTPLAATKAKLRLNQFGGNISGPIPLWKVSPWSDPKLFFFFNLEITRGNRPNGNPFVDVPHPDFLTGDFRRLLRANTIANSTCQYPGEAAPRPCQQGTVFRPGTLVRNAAGNIIGGTPYANNIVPQSEWNRNAAGFLNILNRINRTGAGAVPGGNNPEQVRVFTQDAYQLRKRQEVVRVDYNINPKTNFFFRWVDDSQDEDQGLGIFSGNAYPVLPQFRKKPGSSWSWNLVNVISPTVTNEFIFGYNHLTQVVDVADGVDENSYDRDQVGFVFQEIYPGGQLAEPIPELQLRRRELRLLELRQPVGERGTAIRLDGQRDDRARRAHVQDRRLLQHEPQRPAAGVDRRHEFEFRVEPRQPARHRGPVRQHAARQLHFGHSEQRQVLRHFPLLRTGVLRAGQLEGDAAPDARVRRALRLPRPDLHARPVPAELLLRRPLRSGPRGAHRDGQRAEQGEHHPRVGRPLQRPGRGR